MKKKYKIMVVSDSPFFATGYSTQAKEIFKRLALREDMDVYYLAVGHIGQPLRNASVIYDIKKDKYENLPFTILPTHYPPRDKIHEYGEEGMRTWIPIIKPDLIIILCDTFMIQHLLKPNSNYYHPSKLMIYFPSDGYPLPQPHCTKVLKKADYVVAMAKDGKEQAEKEGVENVYYIPHGVDTDIFKPIEPKRKLELRQKLSKMLGFDITNKFIVGWVGKNQPRKATPEWMKVAQMFARNKKDDILYLLHTNPKDPAGHQLEPLGKRYDIWHLMKFTYPKINLGVSREDLAKIYQVMDVQLSMTTGEGFGICTIEGMACGVPMVITDYTSTGELVPEGTGFKVPVQRTITGSYDVERAFADITYASNKLNYYFHNRNALLQHSMKSVEHIRANYSWDVVYPQWESLIRKVLEDEK